MSPKAKIEKNSPDAIRTLALAEYRRESKTVEGAIYPANAKTAIAAKTGLPKSRLASLVDPVYFRENGLASPLPLGKAKTPLAVARAIRKRRDAGGTLGRWESVAASTSAALGRPVSETAVRALYSKGGGTLEASYVGRGTRKAAPATRANESVEVETTLA
jgi:hypothetical protein